MPLISESDSESALLVNCVHAKQEIWHWLKWKHKQNK